MCNRIAIKAYVMVESGSGDRKRSDHVTDSDSDSRPTSMTSQSVDEDMNINEAGVEATSPSQQPGRSSLRKCHSLATTRQLSADDRAVQVEQLHRIVHVSCSHLLPTTSIRRYNYA